MARRDIVSVGNPSTGAWVWDSLGADTGGNWYILAGTSLTAPMWAGIVNAAGRFAVLDRNIELYSAPQAEFNAITVGNCGFCKWELGFLQRSW